MGLSLKTTLRGQESLTLSRLFVSGGAARGSKVHSVGKIYCLRRVDFSEPVKVSRFLVVSTFEEGTAWHVRPW